MVKNLTITLTEEVCQRLHHVIGRGKISQFIESLVRPHVLERDLEVAYHQMAHDEEREGEAFEWTESLIEDVANETW